MQNFDLGGLIEMYAVLGVLSYAMHTMPVPESKWARWAVGVLQYAVLNFHKGKEALGQPKPEEPKQ